jgi:hypothetical protein
MAIIKFAVLLEGQEKGDFYQHDVVLPDLSWMEQLLDELKGWNPLAFEAAFKFKTTEDLWKHWRASGVSGYELTCATHELRKAAFDANHNGEVAVLLKNSERLSDIQPGVSVTLAAVLEYLAAISGSTGILRCEHG